FDRRVGPQQLPDLGTLISDQFRDEQKIVIAGGGIESLDGKHVGAGPQEGLSIRYDESLKRDGRGVGAVGRRLGVPLWRGWRVRPGNFAPINVSHEAVVKLSAEKEGVGGKTLWNDERNPAENGGIVLIHGGFDISSKNHFVARLCFESNRGLAL